MLFLLATLAAASATSHSVIRVPDPAAITDRCHTQITYAKNGAKQREGLRRLGEEPPANEYLAVVRMAGGCPEPAVVKTGIGR